MAQYGRPDSDVDINNYTDQASGTTNIFQSIDEVTASDADYVKSDVAPDSSAAGFGLSNIEDPQVNSGHIVRYKYKKDASGGATINMRVELRQGYLGESSQGTLIHTESLLNVPGSAWQTGTFTLTSSEANTITDYTNLQIRIWSDQA